MVGDSPLGPFRMHSSGKILPEEWPVQPYASRLVRWGEEWVMLGTVVGDSQSICDPIPVTADACDPRDRRWNSRPFFH